MFSKAARGAAAPVEPSTPRKLTVASLIAEGVQIRGDMATDGDLHLDGSVEGDLKVGQLTIGESGQVSGSIEADSIEVRGRVTGTISARRVRLLATSRVHGDISHGELSIESGAHFEGRSLMNVPAPVVENVKQLTVAAE